MAMQKLLLMLLCMSSTGAFAGSSRALKQATPYTSCCDKLQAIGFKGDLPVVVIDSSGADIPHGIDTNVTVCTCNNGAAFKDFEAPGQAAGRGTSSSNFTKKSYKLDMDKSVSFLGMPENKDWILYGPELDQTQGMRNYLTYNLARASGRYASRSVYCEVFLLDDGLPLSLNHYNGIYIGLEKMEIAKDRVNITKLTPPNLSGGYLFLYDNDNIEAGDVTFGPPHGFLMGPFQMKDPKDAPPEALQWLLNYINNFTASLSLDRPDWIQQYPEFIDVSAFVDYFAIVELTKNPDGYRGSTYMYKDADKPFGMGPAWDYNEAYGSCCGYPIEGWQNNGVSGPGISGGSAISPEGYRFNICEDQDRCVVDPSDGTSMWYRKLWRDPGFKQAIGQRWQELRRQQWSDAAINDLIDGAERQIQDAAMRNYQKYESVLKSLAAGKYATGEEQFAGEVAALKSWTLARVAWLDQALASA